MVVAMPAKAGVSLVAVETQSVLHINRGFDVGTEVGARWWSFLTAPNATRVIARRSVASLALQLAVAERPVRVRRYGVCTAEQREGGVFLVAGKTGVGAFSAVVGFLTVSRADGQGH